MLKHSNMTIKELAAQRLNRVLDFSKVIDTHPYDVIKNKKGYEALMKV
jgi:hypothetical protein